MDNAAGKLLLADDDADLVGLVHSMAQALVDSQTCTCEGTAWNDSRFAFRTVPAAGASDACVRFPDPNTLIYFQGQPRWAGSDTLVIDDFGVDPGCVHSQQARDLYLRRTAEDFAALDGSFMIMIYDTTKGELTITADRLGSRPVFYAATDNRLTFATDIRALLRDPNTHFGLDPNAVVEFLRLTMIFGDGTLFKQIRCLSPGSFLSVSQSGIQSQRYWIPRCAEVWDKSDDDYSHSLADVFRRACNVLIEDPSDTALMLSGGLDSRMIAAALCSSGKHIRSVSFGGFRNDEVKLAERVAKTCGLPFSFLQRSPGYYREISPNAVRISNGLYSFFHAHMLGVHDDVRSLGIRTLVHGWGLDLPFSASYLPKRAVHHLPGRSVYLLRPRQMTGEDDVAASLFAKLALPSDDLTDRLVSTSLSAAWREWPQEVIRAKVRNVARYAKDPYNQHDLAIFEQFSKFRSFLYPMSVRWGARERCPLFDNRLIDLFLELPPRLRFFSRAYGRALAVLNKDLARLPYSRTGVSILAPEPVQSLSYFLLPTIYRLRLSMWRATGRIEEHPSEYFHSYPDVAALLRHTPLLDDLAQELRVGGFFDLGLVNPDTVSVMIERHRHGVADYAEYLAALLTLSLWLNQGVFAE